MKFLYNWYPNVRSYRISAFPFTLQGHSRIYLGTGLPLEHKIVLFFFCFFQSTKSQIEDACDILPLLMRKTGSKLEGNIDPLLKALLNTITSKSVTRISRKLLMIYAHLLNSRFNTVFSFLANASSPSGQPSPLECVVSEGFCRGYNTFQGEDRKSVKLALGKILEHGVTNQYSRLHQITFKDENTQGE